MDVREALAFIRRHGVVLMSARGIVPNLAEAIAGEPIRGSWWGHPKSRQMFRVFEGVRDSGQVLVCRLAGGRITFVHRRLWPALVRLQDALPKRSLAAVRDEHTARGAHRRVVTPFARWAPKSVVSQARRITAARAEAMLGPDLIREASRRKPARTSRAAGRAASPPRSRRGRKRS